MGDGGGGLEELSLGVVGFKGRCFKLRCTIGAKVTTAFQRDGSGGLEELCLGVVAFKVLLL